MSGLEIVGIVLSTIPLIIAGLDHYAGGVDVIKVIRHFSQEFRALARKLEAESVVFRNTLTILLHECVEVRVQKALMDDITGKAWSGREVEQALRHTLKDSYTSYIEYVRNIHEALDSFRQRLHIDQSGKVCCTTWETSHVRLIKSSLPSMALVHSDRHTTVSASHWKSQHI